MLKTVKIDKGAYIAMKALAKKRGVFLQHILNEAIRQFLIVEQSKDQAA